MKEDKVNAHCLGKTLIIMQQGEDHLTKIRIIWNGFYFEMNILFIILMSKPLKKLYFYSGFHRQKKTV